MGVWCGLVTDQAPASGGSAMVKTVSGTTTDITIDLPFPPSGNTSGEARPPTAQGKFLAKSSLDGAAAAAGYWLGQMAVLRTIFALLIAVSVATLPAAGAATFKLHPQEAPEMSASEPMHDCCPPAADPCDKADCASMATCASPCCIYPGAGASPLVYPTRHAELIPLLPSDALPSHMGGPPFRPPRA